MNRARLQRRLVCDTEELDYARKQAINGLDASAWEDRVEALKIALGNGRVKNFALGVLTVTVIDAISVWIDPLISAHLWCLISNSARCFHG